MVALYTRHIKTFLSEAATATQRFEGQTSYVIWLFREMLQKFFLLYYFLLLTKCLCDWMIWLCRPD